MPFRKRNFSQSAVLAAAAGLFAWGSAVSAQSAPPTVPVVTMDPAELFAFSDRARDTGDFASAEAAYRALATKSARLSATFRALKVRRFAPIVKVEYERNFSTIEPYDYRRIAANFGVTAAL